MDLFDLSLLVYSYNWDELSSASQRQWWWWVSSSCAPSSVAVLYFLIGRFNAEREKGPMNAYPPAKTKASTYWTKHHTDVIMLGQLRVPSSTLPRYIRPWTNLTYSIIAPLLHKKWQVTVPDRRSCSFHTTICASEMALTGILFFTAVMARCIHGDLWMPSTTSSMGFKSCELG